jgi:hypothetical protein
MLLLALDAFPGRRAGTSLSSVSSNKVQDRIVAVLMDSRYGGFGLHEAEAVAGVCSMPQSI